METGQVLLILPNGSGGSIRSPTRGQESSAEIPVTDRVASIEFEMPRSLKDHKLGLGTDLLRNAGCLCLCGEPIGSSCQDQNGKIFGNAYTCLQRRNPIDIVNDEWSSHG